MLFGFFAHDKPGRMQAWIGNGSPLRSEMQDVRGAHLWSHPGVCLGEFGSADGRIRQAPILKYDISLPNSVSRCNPPCWDGQREDLGLGRQKDPEIRVITCVWWMNAGERASGSQRFGRWVMLL